MIYGKIQVIMQDGSIAELHYVRDGKVIEPMYWWMTADVKPCKAKATVKKILEEIGYKIKSKPHHTKEEVVK